MESTVAFLIRSQRTVIEHCRRLLVNDDLLQPQAQRLRALLASAEAELERMKAGR